LIEIVDVWIIVWSVPLRHEKDLLVSRHGVL
jgi:hypothetical protein